MVSPPILSTFVPFLPQASSLFLRVTKYVPASGLWTAVPWLGIFFSQTLACLTPSLSHLYLFIYSGARLWPSHRHFTSFTLTFPATFFFVHSSHDIQCIRHLFTVLIIVLVSSVAYKPQDANGFLLIAIILAYALLGTIGAYWLLNISDRPLSNAYNLRSLTH